MSEFRTVINLQESDIKISYDSTLLFIGSCFSDNIGSKFKERRFEAGINPFGVLYNPESVKRGLEILLEKSIFDEDLLFEYRGLWNSFYHHGRFSGVDKKTVLKNINRNIIRGHELLKNAGFLFVTFGTSWVYRNVDDGMVVANCHKLPASRFNRFRLGVDDIVDGYDELIARMKEFNRDLKIIFTVSPVRHLKDGAHGNQLSKATLLLAVDKLTEKHENVFYFPAYELVMDDLRDYRFYADDMVHPSAQAVDYIWENISDVYFDKKAKVFVKEMDKIIKAREHRPFNEKSKEYQMFVSGLLRRLDEIKKQFTLAGLEKDIEIFKRKLAEF
jgi:hypothetical protein